jgi:hypothetical protein
MSILNSGTSGARAGRIESIFLVPLAGAIGAVVEHMFYYTDGDSRGPEDFTARIALIEPEQAAPEVKEIYEQKLKGKPGCVQKALAHRPEMRKNFLGFYASVGRSLDRNGPCQPDQPVY